MHYVDGISKTQIAKLTGLSKQFVIDWTRTEAQDLEADRRGWPMGQGRLWDETTRRRIRQIHRELERDPREFYSGPTAIAQRYRRSHPGEPVPALRTIGRMLKELGLSQTAKKRAKGASRYLCYPEHTVYETLGRRVLEADFIGEKYLAGRTAPLHFVGMSFKKTPRVRHFYRVEAATTDAMIGACEDFFRRFEIPDVMKIDNAQATIGTSAAPRCLSRFMVFLLKQKMLPVFSVPRRPFSQASIEGNNSVFTRKFWNSTEFKSVRQVDARLEWFNDSSLAYTGYDTSSRKRRAPKTDFAPKVYFIRQVKQSEETGKGYIDVLNEIVPIRKDYSNYFVLAEWNLINEKLSVYFEREQTTKVIKNMDFAVNRNSRYKVK